MLQIYIADDNTEFANYLATVAQRDGWETEVCANGRILLNRLSAGVGPAFVLVDINMPEMDGIEAIKGIAELDRDLHLRFMTGGDDTTIFAAKLIAQARNLTVGPNIFKPIGMDDLKALLHAQSKVLRAH